MDRYHLVDVIDRLVPPRDDSTKFSSQENVKLQCGLLSLFYAS